VHKLLIAHTRRRTHALASPAFAFGSGMTTSEQRASLDCCDALPHLPGVRMRQSQHMTQRMQRTLIPTTTTAIALIGIRARVLIVLRTAAVVM
jgi:hypothetical protein